MQMPMTCNSTPLQPFGEYRLLPTCRSPTTLQVGTPVDPYLSCTSHYLNLPTSFGVEGSTCSCATYSFLPVFCPIQVVPGLWCRNLLGLLGKSYQLMSGTKSTYAQSYVSLYRPLKLHNSLAAKSKFAFSVLHPPYHHTSNSNRQFTLVPIVRILRTCPCRRPRNTAPIFIFCFVLFSHSDTTPSKGFSFRISLLEGGDFTKIRLHIFGHQ